MLFILTYSLRQFYLNSEAIIPFYSHSIVEGGFEEIS